MYICWSYYSFNKGFRNGTNAVSHTKTPKYDSLNHGAGMWITTTLDKASVKVPRLFAAMLAREKLYSFEL